MQAAERNRCELIPCEGGFLALRGSFDPVAAATLKTALDLGAVPTTGGASTHLQLTASVETVIGLDGASGGDLEFAGPVPAATVQRLACDARVRRVLLGPSSAVLDVGRALRLPSPAARAALRARAGGGEWPGCDRPVAFTNAHHLVHWGHGAEPTWTTSSIADISPGGVRIARKLTLTGRPALRYPAVTDGISDRPSCFVFER